MSGEEEGIRSSIQNRDKRRAAEQAAETGIGTICTYNKPGNLLGAGHFTGTGGGTHQPGHCSGFVAALDQSWSCGEVLQ